MENDILSSITKLILDMKNWLIPNKFMFPIEKY